MELCLATQEFYSGTGLEVLDMEKKGRGVIAQQYTRPPLPLYPPQHT